MPALERVTNIYIAGIGGLGVLTVGALLVAAAHIEGLSATVLDFTGLAQKNGAVVSQVRIAPPATTIHAVRIGRCEIAILIGLATLVAPGVAVLLTSPPGRPLVVSPT